MIKKRAQNFEGFTLLEILIAVFILAIITSIVFSSYTATFKITGEAESQAYVYQMARIALERMQEDLECAIILKRNNTIEENNTPGSEEGFLGENDEIDERSADTLTFLSTKHVFFNDEDDYRGLTRITYYVSKSDDTEAFLFFRSETQEHEKPSEEKTGGLLLCDGLFSLTINYYDENGDEYDEWNSSETAFMDKLPARVAVTLEFMNESNSEELIKFVTSIAPPMARDQYGEEESGLS